MKFSRAQTATEYLIILSVVIIIALIVIGVLNGIPGLSGGSEEREARLNLKVLPIGVSHYYSSPYITGLTIINNQRYSVEVLSITLGGMACQTTDLPTVLKVGRQTDIICKNSFSQESGTFFNEDLEITYEDVSNTAQYTIDDAKLIGQVSEGTCASMTGLGTFASPFSICTCDDLQSIEDNLTASYEVLTNIDCSETLTWNSGAGFDAIGTSGNRFEGSFDGNGFIISDLYIYSQSYYEGLFGVVGSSGIVTNVGVTDANITGRAVSGIVVGLNYGNITLSYSGGYFSSTTEIESQRWNNGGLVGENYGLIDQTFSSAQVTSHDVSAGGLIGRNFGAVKNSYATGRVFGQAASGAFIGIAQEGTIEDSYASGNISQIAESGVYDTGYISGFVGHTRTTSVINNSFTISALISGTRYIGGFVGQTQASSDVTNAYWLNKTTNPNVSIGSDTTSGSTSVTIIDSASHPPYFATTSNPPLDTWDFTTIWAICGSTDLPYLQALPSGCS